MIDGRLGRQAHLISLTFKVGEYIAACQQVLEKSGLEYKVRSQTFATVDVLILRTVYIDAVRPVI
jgi:hypothetical protein